MSKEIELNLESSKVGNNFSKYTMMNENQRCMLCRFHYFSDLILSYYLGDIIFVKFKFLGDFQFVDLQWS